MKILKGEIVYIVREQRDFWVVCRNMEKIQAEYRITKESCVTFEELEEYVLNSSSF